MTSVYEAALDDLARLGWIVEQLSRPQPLPDEIVERYPDIPADYRAFVETTWRLSSPADTAWFVTSQAFSPRSQNVWEWNAWEQQSLEAAGDDVALAEATRSFWDAHLPVLMSTKSCYAYFALNLNTLEVVQGSEPEYEETGPLASSLAEMFRLIVSEDERVRLFV